MEVRLYVSWGDDHPLRLERAKQRVDRVRVDGERTMGELADAVDQLVAVGGRLGDQVEDEERLARLEAFAGEADPRDDARLERKRLVAAAGEALWYYVVQREACGLRDTERVLRKYRVPREVRLRMGPASLMSR
jgi:hypothetical protein